MKKIISFILVLSLVLGSFSTVFATTSSNNTFKDIEGENCETAVTILTNLGVVDGLPDGTFGHEKTVTRAEMAKLIITQLGLNTYAGTVSATSFSDVDVKHWAAGYIEYAVSLGIVKGYGDGKFGPEDTVTYNEAITMIIRAIGYSDEAKEIVGTWPAAHVMLGKSLGITNDITLSGKSGASRGDIAIMLYNGLDIPMVYIDADGVTQEVTTSKDKTMLNRLGGYAYNADSSGEPQAFVMGANNEDDDSLINVKPYIGAYVTAYANKDGDIIIIKEVKSTTLTGKFDVKDKEFKTNGITYDLSSNDLEYIDSDKKTVSAETFTNGNVTSNPLKYNENTLVTLNVEISGKNIKNVYSICEWVEDAGLVSLFTKEDAEDIEDDMKLFGVKFTQTDDKEIDLDSFELVGVDSLDDIKVDNVVYVYKNKDKEISRVAVGTDVAKGKVSRVNSNGDEITIDKKIYTYATENTVNSVGEVNKNDIKAGDEVELLLDAYGSIYDFEYISGTASKYGVIVDYADGDGFSGLNNKNPKLQLLLSDGTVKIFDATDDIDKSILDADADWNVANDSVTYGAIVKYGTNSSGKIDNLEIPNTTTADKTITASKTYNGKVIDNGVSLFTNTGDLTDRDDYGIASLDNVLGADAEAKYVLDSGKIVAMLILDYSDADTVWGVFTDWNTQSGDYDYAVTMYVGGKEVTYDANKATKDSAANNSNTLYKIKFNADGSTKEAIAFDTASSNDDKIRNVEVEVTTYGATLSGNILTTYTGDDGSNKIIHTIDSNVAIYIWDGTAFDLGNKSDLRNTTYAGMTLYDVNDDDDIYDIIIIDDSL